MADEKKNNKNREETHLQAVRFAAGIAALLACFERAMAVSFFVERWRVWVFLAVNLLLMAILFTSANSNPASDEDDRSSSNCLAPAEEDVGPVGGGGDNQLPEVMKSENQEAVAAEEPQLSKEELNERVEAFIAMFRRHLILDAKGKTDFRPQFVNKPILV